MADFVPGQCPKMPSLLGCQNVKFKQKKDKDFKIFEGCGNMVPDYRLNGVWKIVKVNDQYINPDSFQNKEPQITFDLFSIPREVKRWSTDYVNWE